MSLMVPIKSQAEIKVMAAGGHLTARILAELSREIRPGLSTAVIDQRARELVEQAGVKAAFLGYNGFPAAICTSINDEVVHGIPSTKRILQAGDIIGLDFGIIYEGWNLDTAVTIAVGEVDALKKKLIEVTKESLALGIEQARVGNRVGAISQAIQAYVEARGFGVVRDLVGHGVGRKLHEPPQVPNFGNVNEGLKLKAGMVIAIEPMINTGTWQVRLDADNWTYRTKDGSPSAHFEHTVAITESGPLILTAYEA